MRRIRGPVRAYRDPRGSAVLPVPLFSRLAAFGLAAFLFTMMTGGGCSVAVPPAADAVFENSLGMRFVALPGTDARISVYETRVQDFAAFAAATGFKAGDKLYTWINDEGRIYEGYSWRNPGFAQEASHPVGGVSWNDAQDFCRWLTEKERAAGRIGARQRYRLPTDAEWSLAVGLTGESGATPAEKDSRMAGVYPWGTQWPPPPHAGNFGDTHWKDPTDLRNYDDGFKFTAPVGTYGPNRHGICDLSGNVYEWCEDEYQPGENKRVMRGGAFNSRAKGRLLSTERIYFEPQNRSANHGFRCVLSP